MFSSADMQVNQKMYQRDAVASSPGGVVVNGLQSSQVGTRSRSTVAAATIGFPGADIERCGEPLQALTTYRRRPGALAARSFVPTDPRHPLYDPLLWHAGAVYALQCAVGRNLSASADRLGALRRGVPQSAAVHLCFLVPSSRADRLKTSAVDLRVAGVQVWVCAVSYRPGGARIR